jgi:hypothetical protein
LDGVGDPIRDAEYQKKYPDTKKSCPRQTEVLVDTYPKYFLTTPENLFKLALVSMRKSHRISGLNFETRRAALICYGLPFLSGMCTNCEKKLNLQIQVDESDVVMDFSSFHIVSVELNIDTTWELWEMKETSLVLLAIYHSLQGPGLLLIKFTYCFIINYSSLYIFSRSFNLFISV